VGEAGDGAEAVELAVGLGPDVVLMDIRMPRMDGMEATVAIVRAFRDREESASADTPPAPCPRILVLTTFDLDERAARAIRAGASGFVLKDADPEFLLAAIRAVHAGTAVISPAATTELFAHLGGSAPGEPGPADEEAVAALSPREREIFLHAARGLSNAEIAAAEFLSEATVKSHVSRILAKLGLRDRVQLVVFAHDRRLI